MIRAAIFDFDELLIDIEAVHHRAERRLAEEYGVDPSRLTVHIPKVSGRRIIDWVADFRQSFAVADGLDTLMARREALMLELLQTSPIELMPGAAETVRLVHGAGLRLAVASSGLASYIELILTRCGLRAYFDAVISGADVHRGKPDPEAYLVASGRLGVPASECVVFEDAAIGVRAAKAAGMICVAVRNPAAEEEQDLSPADLILPSLEAFSLSLLRLGENREEERSRS